MKKTYPFLTTPRQLRPEHIEKYQTSRLHSLRMRPATKKVAPGTCKAPDGKNVSARTVNLELTALRYLIKSYSMRPSVRILSNDITAGIKKVREVKPATRAIPQADLRLVEAALRRRKGNSQLHVLAFRILTETGMRGGELFGLRWKDVDFQGRYLIIDNHELHQVKTRETRQVMMSPRTTDALRSLSPGQPEALIFTDKNGRGLMNAFRLALHRSCIKAGVEPFSMHALRHTAATQMLDSGAPSHWVQKVLGHKHLTTTEKYIHHTQQGADTAVTALWASKEEDSNVVHLQARKLQDRGR